MAKDSAGQASKYKAFITYSHADLRLAEALQRGLHSFAKPWYTLRAVRVFRDQTNLTANPDLWSSIETAIKDSEHLLIMASPEAAASQWVPREIESFLQTKSSDRVILILSGGDLAWDATSNDFDWQTTTAFPKLPRKVFSHLPLYLDLRWARKDEHLSMRNPDFRAAVANLSSTLRGIPLDVLTGQDVREHRKALRLAWSAVSGLSLLAVTLTIVSIFAFRSRARAIEERNVAVSRQLAVESRTYLDQGLDLANLLAIEAARTKDTVEARGALLEAIQRVPQLVTVLHSHNAPVTAVAFGTDGVLASGGRDGDPTIRLWNEKNFQPLVPPVRAEKFRVEYLAYSPDGKILASAGDGGVVHLWNGKTMQSLGPPLVVDPPNIGSLAFSPNGTLAVGGGWGGLSLWNAATGKAVIGPIQAHPEEWNDREGSGGSNSVESLAYSPDGQILATGADDGTIRFWDATALKPVLNPIRASPPGPGGGIDSLAFAPEGRVLASAGNRTIQLWDPQSGRRIAGPVHVETSRTDLIYATAGTLISAGDDGALRIWDGRTLKVLRPAIPAHQPYVWSLALSKDGLIASAGADGSIFFWDLNGISPIATSLHPNSGRTEGLAFGSDGILASAGGDLIELLKAGSKEASGPALNNTESVSSLAFGANGILAAGGVHGSVRLWDVASQRPIAQASRIHTSVTAEGQPMEDIVSAVAFTPDGSVLASGGFIDGSFRLWNGRTLAPITDQPVAAEVGYLDSIAFSPDGKTMALSSEKGAIRLWDVNTRRPLSPPIRAHGTGRPLVVFGSNDNSPGGQVTIGEGEGPTFVAYSPDGRLVSGGFDKTIRLWNGKTAEPIGAPIAFPTPVRSLAFSPDGTFLACGGWDGRVRLWDARSLQYVGVLLGRPGRITRIAFSDDGSTIAAGYEDGAVIRWVVTLASWEAAAQSIANRALSQAEYQEFLSGTR